MALSILINNGKNILHTPQHDLESLLYILLNIFTSNNGPGNLRVVQDSTSIPLLEWFQDVSSYRRLGRNKQGQLADFSYAIKNHFSDYWKPLADVAHAVFRCTFPDGLDGHAPEPQVQHNQMMTILNATIFFLGHSENDNFFPQITNPLSARKSASRRPSGLGNRPTYPKKRSASRIEAASEESVPPRKRSRMHTRGALSARESADTPAFIDGPPTALVRRSSRSRSSVVAAQTTSTSSSHIISQTTSSSSHATPELRPRGRVITRREPGSKLGYLLKPTTRRGSVG